MNVYITPAAEGYISDIGNWIAGDNPRRAISFILELRAACIAIGEAPKGSVVVQRYMTHDVRRKTFRDYLNFYRIKNSVVEILHVIHGAPDYKNLF